MIYCSSISGGGVVRMDKTISVRVVEWSGDDRTTVGTSEATVTADGGVEAAVRVAYPVFPNNCLRVVLVRGGGVAVLLWHKHVGAWVHSRADAYTLVQEGDVVEVQLRVDVLGPDKGAVPAVYSGPDQSNARLVCDLLRQLKHVGGAPL